MVAPGVAVHVIQRGNNRQAIFFASDDYGKFLEDLGVTSHAYSCEIHAYVLITNQVHLLLTPKIAGAVSQMMQALGRRYVRYINGTYRRSDTFWEGRFRSSVVGTDRYWLACSRYIEMNPVRAEMVAAPGDYPYLSYASNAHGDADPLVVSQPAYLALATTPAARSAVYRATTRTEADFAAHLAATVETDPDASGILGTDQLDTHCSATLVERVAKRCGIQEDLGVKGQTGILKSKPTRRAFLQDPAHRIRFVYTPRHCSWLNQVEIWFSIIARRLLKRACFTSLEDLQTRVLDFIHSFNHVFGKPFRWTITGRPLQA